MLEYLPKSSLLIHKETQEREQVIANLSTLEGYRKLSDRQKRMINASLYFDQRVHRGIDPSLDYFSQFDRNYAQSQEFWESWYCIAAMVTLENETSIKPSLPSELPKDFFYGIYNKVKDLDELTTKIRDEGFPRVVNICKNPANISDVNWYHSFLALGTDASGQIKIWEKQGYLYSFRVTELKDVYKDFSTSEYYWGTRRLKSNNL